MCRSGRLVYFYFLGLGIRKMNSVNSGMNWIFPENIVEDELLIYTMNYKSSVFDFGLFHLDTVRSIEYEPCHMNILKNFGNILILLKDYSEILSMTPKE